MIPTNITVQDIPDNNWEQLELSFDEAPMNTSERRLLQEVSRILDVPAETLKNCFPVRESYEGSSGYKQVDITFEVAPSGSLLTVHKRVSLGDYSKILKFLSWLSDDSSV